MKDISEFNTSNYGPFKCPQCHKEVSPVSAMLGEVCHACCVRNHKRSAK